MGKPPASATGASSGISLELEQHRMAEPGSRENVRARASSTGLLSSRGNRRGDYGRLTLALAGSLGAILGLMAWMRNVGPMDSQTGEGRHG